jgi:type IV pilus assembly protein PilN
MENRGFIVINLLPYREKIKKEKLKQFGILIGGFVVAAGAVILAGSTYLGLKIEDQTQRNKYVETQNKKLDDQIKEIAGLKDEIKDTLAKRQVVENLQVNRSDAVNILNELSKQLPEGVILKTVKQTNNKIAITGTTPANSKIANYMNNLDNTSIFENSQIVEIKLVTVPVVQTAAKGGQKVAEDIKESDFLIMVDLEPKPVLVEDNKNTKPVIKK